MNEQDVRRLSSADARQLLVRIEPNRSRSEEISRELQQTVFGQETACKAVGRRLALFETGLNDQNRPMGSLFLLGPSGVGKTEMAHAVAQHMFGNPNSERLKIINMAEYTQDHYTSRFVGSPQGYVGHDEEGAIPHDWLSSGRSIVVLDEFDKAHPKVRQLFLGVLDKGKMDARNKKQGIETLDFNECILIFTTNTGGEQIHKITSGNQGIGFHPGGLSQEERTRRIQTEALKGLELLLSPEFRNRIDDFVVFQELTDPLLYDRMVTKFIDARNTQIANRRPPVIENGNLVPDENGNPVLEPAPHFEVTVELRQHLIKQSVGKGGRELRRLMESLVFDKAADVFMGNDVRNRLLVADIEGERVVFYADEPSQLIFQDEESQQAAATAESREKQVEISRRPIVTASGGGTSEMGPISEEFTREERSSWGQLLREFSRFDRRVSKTNSPDTIPLSFQFTMETDNAKDELPTTQIKALLVDPLTHLPQIVEVSLLVDGDLYMDGVCQVSWRNNSPRLEKVQYHLAVGNSIEKFCDLIKIATKEIRKTKTSVRSEG